jgi:hypothetical protein
MLAAKFGHANVLKLFEQWKCKLLARNKVEASKKLTAIQEVEIAERIAGDWEKAVIYLEPEYFGHTKSVRSGKHIMLLSYKLEPPWQCGVVDSHTRSQNC